MTEVQSQRRTDVGVFIGAELFLALMTITAVAGFSRLFLDRSWVGPLFTAAVVAHLCVAAVRRFGRGLLLSGAVTVVVMTLQITWTHYRPTLRAGLPTGVTRDAVDADLTAAWNLFSEVKAPTEPVVGFVVVASLAIWVIAYLSDWAAFRLWSALETVLPSFALFVFIAFFGDEQDRLAMAALYLAAIVGFQLFHRLMRQSHEVRWLAGTQVVGTSAIMRAGAVVSAVVVLGAIVAGPALPGAETEPILGIDDGNNEADTRIVISPIVDIRGRLVDQKDVEAFTVRSEQPSYWRLASLDSFNGQIWGADNKYGKASGGLDDDFDVDASVTILEQEFTVTNLGAVWIPAAYEPRQLVESSDDSISYEPLSGTLIVGRSLDTSDGLTYTLKSEIPNFDPAALAAAPNSYPKDVLDRYLDLPEDFSATARSLAFDIARDAGATNDFEEALALQNFFRDSFTYDLTVGEGHSSARIDQFLASGIGYCEQFAGAFAAMARALEIPSRVAVGFTWGEADAEDPNLYHVRGEHAHAWPEVYIPGSGWVPFEPTPTRGAPNAAQWTGVDAEQASGDTTEAPPAPVATPSGEDPRALDDLALPPEPEVEPLSDIIEDQGVPGWVKIVGLVAIGGVAVAGIYAALVVGLKRRRTTRRFAQADSNSQRVNAVWSETVESLSPLGLQPVPSETMPEFARRAGTENVLAKADLEGLGTLAVAARYGPHDADEAAVATAQSHRDAVVTSVIALSTSTERLKDSLDPRVLVKR